DRCSSTCIEMTSGSRFRSGANSKSTCQTCGKRSHELGSDAPQLPDIFVIVVVDDAAGEGHFQKGSERLLRPNRLGFVVFLHFHVVIVERRVPRHLCPTPQRKLEGGVLRPKRWHRLVTQNWDRPNLIFADRPGLDQHQRVETKRTLDMWVGPHFRCDEEIEVPL